MDPEAPTKEFIQSVDSLGEKVNNLQEPKRVTIFINELPVGKDLLSLVSGMKIEDDKILKSFSKELESTTTWQEIDKLILQITKNKGKNLLNRYNLRINKSHTKKC